MTDEIVIFITTSSVDESEKLARYLVGKKLVACVNILETVHSIFRWQGKVEQESESMMILKSVRPNLEQIITEVKAQHSYDTPEVIALPVVGGSEEYLEWVRQES